MNPYQPKVIARTAAVCVFLIATMVWEWWTFEQPVFKSRVAQDASWPGVEFADSHGAPSGMTTDYLNFIEARLGLNFERVQGLCWREAYARRLQRRKINMPTTVSVTEDGRKKFAATFREGAP